MSFYGKNYIFTKKQERFDEFLKAVGLPEDKIPEILNYGPSQKIVKDGDSYTYIIGSSKGPQEKKFKPGVEHDDIMGADSSPIKTTYTIDGNTITQTVRSVNKPERGTATFKREYNGDELVVIITADQFDGVAKRYYKAE